MRPGVGGTPAPIFLMEPKGMRPERPAILMGDLDFYWREAVVLANLKSVGDSVYDDNAAQAENEERPQSAAFLPYAVSTLSPRIVPNDLTSFKSRGISKVQKDTAQRLAELKEQYESIVNEFNWNKLVYESDFRFEPVIGEVYHLYWTDSTHGGVTLSMVDPGEWAKEHIASLQLGFDGRWIPQSIAEGFDLQDALAMLELDSGAASEDRDQD